MDSGEIPMDGAETSFAIWDGRLTEDEIIDGALAVFSIAISRGFIADRAIVGEAINKNAAKIADNVRENSALYARLSEAKNGIHRSNT